MANVVLTREVPVAAGLDHTENALDNVDTYFAKNVGGLLLLFRNTGGSPAVITFDVTKTLDGAAVTDPTVSVPATTGKRAVAALPASWQDDAGPNPGHVKFTCDQATGCTVSVIKV